MISLLGDETQVLVGAGPFAGYAVAPDPLHCRCGTTLLSESQMVEQRQRQESSNSSRDASFFTRCDSRWLIADKREARNCDQLMNVRVLGQPSLPFAAKYTSL